MITFLCPCCGEETTYNTERKPQKATKAISSEFILDLVQRYFKITPERMAKKSHKPNEVFARHAFAYLCRQFTPDGYIKIGEMVGLHHAACIRGVKAIQKRVATKNDALSHINELKRQIRENYIIIKKAA